MTVIYPKKSDFLKRTKTENILTNIDSNIKNDIINALLADIKIEKKSSINKNFINSF